MKKLVSVLGACAAVSLGAFVSGCSSEAGGTDDGTGAGAITSERPPQYVLLAFDGSQSNDFWAESRAFAADNKIKYTYFISGVYFLLDAKKAHYSAPPEGRAGRSDIGFGGTAEELTKRVGHLDSAAVEGHEIASHANGHFDGSRWSAEAWSSEFDQFNDLVFKTDVNNGITAKVSKFKESDVVGFRAPLLGHSPGLYTTLQNKKFLYDTSKSTSPNYWPEKLGGVWNFPLAQIKIVGSGKNTLSMDYNFYVAQSKGVRDANAANQATYEKQMIDTYRKYFADNYYGNRAPVHIGHHFSKWNGGAYWRAMKTFAQEVCGKPEVKCVTYKELAAFLETRTPEQLKDYKNGAFPKLARPGGTSSAIDNVPGTGAFVPDSEASHAEEDENGNPVAR